MTKTAAEQALRDSGVDYTVIRPGALVDCPATPEDLVRPDFLKL